ncbi:hypothetical protein ACHAPT_012180 [Fusarium lateritium]
MNRTYWFLFDGLPETKYGEDISKYSKLDEETLVKERYNDHITEDVTFGELYGRKIMSTLVPLEEYVFDRWHYKRIVTIGDSAHKIDPASGQGGNGAMESAALLVNALVRQLKSSPQGLSGAQVDTALAEVHTLRHERAKRLVEQAHFLQVMISQRFALSRLLLKYLIPYFGQNAFVDLVVPICSEATRIEGIPVPKRPHFVPFEDELPAKPIKGDLVRRAPWMLASGSLGVLLYASIRNLDMKAGTGLMYSALQHWGNGGLLAKLAGQSSGASLVTSLIPTLSTWLIEGSRHGNALNPLSWTRVYSLMYTLAGPNWELPLFCLSSVLFSVNSTTHRPVDPKIARSITPAVLLGYVAPTVAALLPIKDAQIRHYVGIIWQAYPILCVAFTNGLTAVRVWKSKSSTNEEAESKVDEKAIDYASESELQLYKNEDVVPLKFAHGSALAMCVAIPIITKIASAGATHFFGNTTETRLSQVLPLSHTGIIGAASSLVYSLYTAWELRSLGFVGTKQAVLGGLTSLAALGLAGPGAAIASTSYWREHVVSGLSP